MAAPNDYTGGFTLLPQGTNPADTNPLNVNQLPIFGGNNTGAVSGVVYAIQAYGGFSTTQTFENITRLPETMIGQYDVTGALEVLIPCSVFNEKIGIYKTNGVVDNNVSVDYYDISANVMKTDSLVIQASEFVSLVGNVNQIVSVGNFSTLYSDFNSYVAQYFGFANGNFPMGSEWGFGTLFTGELTFSTTQTNQPGIFQAAEFVHLLMSDGTADTTGSGITGHNALNVSSQEQAAGLNYGGDISGAYITNLAGSLTVTGITKLLRNAVDANPFNNRGVESPYWASDAHDNIDFGVTDGFYPNDLFFIPNNGFQITLKLNIDTEAFTAPLNNVNRATTGSNNSTAGQGTNFIDNSGTTVPVSVDNQGIPLTATTTTSRTVTTTLLQRVVSAPLLIRLQETLGIDTQNINGLPVYNNGKTDTTGSNFGNTLL